MIYKLLRPAEWAALAAAGELRGSPADLKDGFIHFSAAAQVRETAGRHFAGEGELVLAEVDSARLPVPVKWEASRGGKLFPHLYGALPLAAVARRWTLLPGADGRRSFPDGF